MKGQPVLVLCLDPVGVRRLHWGLWAELGRGARAGMAHREEQGSGTRLCGHSEPCFLQNWPG